MKDDLKMKASMLEMFHFNGKEHTCENCEDFLSDNCEGHMFESVEECMVDKAKSSFFMSNIEGLN